MNHSTHSLPNHNIEYDEVEGEEREEVAETSLRGEKQPKNRSSRVEEMWRVLGRKIPRSEMVFVCQMSVIIMVVIASIYNLSVGDNDSTSAQLWTALLSSSLGVILPNPRLRER